MNDNVNIYSSDLNSVFNPEEGTVVTWAKVSDAGVWTDGQTRYIARLGIDSNNEVAIIKRSPNNQLQIDYRAGGTNLSTVPSFSSTDFFQVIVTWSKSNDEMKTYVNGSQVGTTRTGLGTWNGNLGSAVAAIGASGSSGSYTFSGLINDVRLYDRALSAEEISVMYSDESDIQVYGTDNYSGKELIRKYNTAITVGTLADEEIGSAPIAYWSFDDPSASSVQVAKDNSGNGNDGTLGANTSVSSDDPTWVTEDQCVRGKCLLFDKDNNQYLSIGNPQILNIGTGAFSASFWVKAPDLSQASNYMGVISKGGYPNGFEFRMAKRTTDYELNGFIGSDVSTSIRVLPNEWVNVALTRDNSGNWKVYKNGILEGSSTNANSLGSGNWEIGRMRGDSQFDFEGLIDEVKIYPYARSAAQIREDYNQGAAVLGSRSNNTFLSDGLVGYWKMDEESWNGTAGEVKDSSGNGHHGTEQNGANAGGGKFGNAGAFSTENNSQFVTTLSRPVLNDNEARSFSYWIRPNSVQNWAIPFAAYNGNGLGGHVYWGASGRLDGRICTTNDGSSYWPSVNPAVNEWNHVVFLYNPQQQTAESYLNGVLIETINMSGVTCLGYPNGNLRINVSGNSFDGNIDEIRYYNRALSPAEVQQLYEYAPGPVGYWKFDEGEGTTAYDSSGNGNNGSFVGSPSWTQGKYGKSLFFNSNYVDLPSNPMAGLSQLTVGMWAYIDNMDSAQRALIGASGGGHYWRRTSNTGNGLLYFLNSACDYETANFARSTNNYFQTGWHYYGFTIDSNGFINIYRDGEVIDSATVNSWDSMCSTSSYWRRLGGYSGSYPWLGNIDEVKIYNYARTQEQILEDMYGGHPIESTEDPVPKVTQTMGGDNEDETIIDGAGAPPIAHWSFDEKTGTTVEDKSGNGNNLAPLSTTPQWTLGKYGSAMNFDGISNQMKTSSDVNLFDFNDTDDFTISGWIKPNSFNRDIITKKGNLNASSPGYALTFNGSTLRFYGADGINHYRMNGSTQLLTGKWYHFAVVWNQDSPVDTSIYINGLKETISTTDNLLAVGSLDNTAPFRIGALSVTPIEFDGEIDEVKIYDYARTPAQIAYDYNRGAPVAWYRFDECEGTTIKDHSGNGNNGTLNIGASGSQTNVGTCDSSGAWKNGKEGRINSSMSFDGVDDWVSLSSAPLLDSSTLFTISAWIKTSVTSDKTIFGQFINNAGSESHRLYLNGGRVSYDEYPPGNGFLTGSKIVNNGEWNHITLVRSNTSRSIYVNGILDVTDASSETYSGATTNTWLIGAQLHSGNYIRLFSGQIDDVRIYNYALSAEQVKQVFNGGAVSFR